MLHNKPFKKITVTGQTINKEYVLAVHNPKDIDYSGVYALKLKAAGKLFRVDFSIAGDNEISYSDVNIGILNIVDNNSGIGTTQTAFNNNFTLKVVQNAAGLNLIIIRMLTVIMSGSFEMTITNSVPTGLDWSDYGKYIGKDYSTIVGYPFANETVKSPVKILGGINAPEVTTTAATSVTSSGMILNANLTTLGSEASVNVAFEWRLVGAGSWTRTSLVAKTTIGTFSATLSGLSSNTTYEYRAVVIGQSNPGNDATGSVLSQLTVAINIDADSGVNITGTSGGSALNTTNISSVTNGAVNNATGLMTATADNCVSQTVEIAQQVGQSDFQLLRTTFALAPYQLAIDPASNTTTLVVIDPESGKFANNSRFWLESAGVMKQVQAASVIETFMHNNALYTCWSIGTANPSFIYYGTDDILRKVDETGITGSTALSFTPVQFTMSVSNTGTGAMYVLGNDNVVRNCTVGGAFGSFRIDSDAPNPCYGVAVSGSNSDSTAGRLYVIDSTHVKIYGQAGSIHNLTLPVPIRNPLKMCVPFSPNTGNPNVIYVGTDGLLYMLNQAGSTSISIPFTPVQLGVSTSNVSTNTLYILDNTGKVYTRAVADGSFPVGGFILDSSAPAVCTGITVSGDNNDSNNCRVYVSSPTTVKAFGQVGAVDNLTLTTPVKNSSIGYYKYTCTSLTSLFGGAITNTPTLAYKAGQSFESSITTTSGTTSYVADTLYSVSRSGNILTLIFNQRSATGRYARSKATVNKGDVISRYAIDLWN